MTPDEIKQGRELLAKATPEPWRCEFRGDGSGSVYQVADGYGDSPLLDDTELPLPMLRGELRYEDGLLAIFLRNHAAELLDAAEDAEAFRVRCETNNKLWKDVKVILGGKDEFPVDIDGLIAQIRNAAQRLAITIQLRDRLAAENADLKKRLSDVHRPTHGPCCTCQRCGKHYDDCRCDLDEVIAENAALKQQLSTKLELSILDATGQKALDDTLDTLRREVILNAALRAELAEARKAISAELQWLEENRDTIAEIEGPQCAPDHRWRIWIDKNGDVQIVGVGETLVAAIDAARRAEGTTQSGVAETTPRENDFKEPL